MTAQAHVLDALSDGRERRRRGGRPLWGLLDRPLRTLDGSIVLRAAEQDELARLCRICDVTARAGEAETAIAERIGLAPSARWEEALAEEGIPCAAVCTDLAGLPGEPALAALFEELGGGARAPASPWRLSP